MAERKRRISGGDGFRILLCSVWRARTMWNMRIESISDAPLTVWLISGRWP